MNTYDFGDEYFFVSLNAFLNHFAALAFLCCLLSGKFVPVGKETSKKKPVSR